MLNDIDFTNKLGDLNLRAIKFKKNVKKRCRPIEPDSTFKSWWDLAGMVLIIFEAIVIPYRVCFSIPSGDLFLSFEYFIDAFFITDISNNLLHFN